MERRILAEKLLAILPMMFKKMMKGIPESTVSKQQIHLLNFINFDNEKPMSWYSDRMMIPKPNVTVLADKLIEEGFVERGFDPADRRVIILKITPKGTDFLNYHKEIILEVMAKKFEKIETEEIKKLLELFDQITKIIDKIE